MPRRGVWSVDKQIAESADGVHDGGNPHEARGGRAVENRFDRYVMNEVRAFAAIEGNDPRQRLGVLRHRASASIEREGNVAKTRGGNARPAAVLPGCHHHLDAAIAQGAADGQPVRNKERVIVNEKEDFGRSAALKAHGADRFSHKSDAAGNASSSRAGLDQKQLCRAFGARYFIFNSVRLHRFHIFFNSWGVSMKLGPIFYATGSFLMLLAVAGTSHAQDGEMSGFEAGIRLGYGFPLGSVVKDSAFSDGLSGMVPIWLDAGYRINPNWYVGAYGQYGFISVKEQSPGSPGGCAPSQDCSAHSIRFGVMGQYHILPAGPFDPWVGLGLGYEMLSISSSVGAQKVDASLSGFEFANLQLGGDYKVSRSLGIGPFASFSLGQYSSASTSLNGVSTSVDIKDKALHEWFVVGVRGTYGVF